MKWFAASNIRTATAVVCVCAGSSAVEAPRPVAANKEALTLTAKISKNVRLTSDFDGTLVVKSDGIVIDGNGHTVKRIVLKDRKDVLIKNCIIKNATRAGIVLVKCRGIRLVNNTVTGCAGDGIGLRDSRSNLLCNNVVRSNKGSGILLKNSNENYLFSNTVTSSGKSGIVLGGSFNLVSGSTIGGD